MNTQRIYGIFLRQMYLLRDNPTRLFQLFIWVTVDLVIWGFITKYLSTVVLQGFNATTIFLGAVVMWGFHLRVMQGITTPMLEDVWSKNFLNLFASPLEVREYIAGLVLTSIVTSLFVLAAMLVLALSLFGLNLLALGIGIVLSLMTLFLFAIALGIFGVAIVLRYGPSAEWLVWPIPAILNPFVGVFYPVSTLPVWMQLLSHALAPSYVFEAMRSLVLSGTFSIRSLAIGILLAAVCIALAYGFFAYIFRRVVREGLIARFEAEGP